MELLFKLPSSREKEVPRLKTFSFSMLLLFHSVLKPLVEL